MATPGSCGSASASATAPRWLLSSWWSRVRTEKAVRTFALTLEYDGTGYAGFQIQRDRPTIQGEVERAIAGIAGSPVRIVGAGRTDAGVHATGQVVSFTTESRLGAEEWQRALNARLPPSIGVRSAWEASPGFHARFSAVSRAYRFTIANRRPRPVLDRCLKWHVPDRLDDGAMAIAARSLEGCHDFSAFAGASGEPLGPRGAVRQVLRCTCERIDDDIRVEVEADAFLPHMVRNIVGTLVAVGRGDLAVEEVASILRSRQRARASATAPPHGLCLIRVNYGDL